MRSLALALTGALVLAGCASPSGHALPLQPHSRGACNLPPNLWTLTDAPTNEETLLDIIPTGGTSTVRATLRTRGRLSEAWFKSTQDDALHLCLYDPRRTCIERSDYQSATFQKVDSEWVAEKIVVHRVCNS